MMNNFKAILSVGMGVRIRTGLLTPVAAITPVLGATSNVANGDVPGLIAAINAANANPDADIINLAAGGTYTLTTVDNTGFYGPTGLPVISSPITINGNGATIQRSTVAGTPDFRILLVSNGPSQLTLNGITIAGGQGGGSLGAGLLNTGSLSIVNSTVTRNVGVAGDGGGIFNYCGTLTVTNSTISNNKSLSGYGGGGVLNFSSYCQATTTIVNSTIFENANTVGRGDAIADAFSPAGSVVLKNSIVASPTQGLGSVCYAVTLTSLGHNIAGDASCGLTGSGDLSSTNPRLGALALNGGTTQTHAPLAGSPALDAVPISTCTDATGNPVVTDQRGIARPQGVACDIGSVELVQGTGTEYILYDTLGGPPLLRGQGNPVTITSPNTYWSALATRFTVSGQAAILTGFDLALATSLPNQVTVSIYRDGIGVPGQGADLGVPVASATFVNAQSVSVPGLVRQYSIRR